MHVKGTPYEVMLTGNGYFVMRPTSRSGGAAVMQAVAGPFVAREEATVEARKVAAMQEP